MKFQNRFVRLGAALAIIGIVISQIPIKSTIAQAADGYNDNTRGLFSLKGGGGLLAGGVLVGVGYGALTKAGAGAAVGGGSGAGAILGNEPIYDVTNRKPEQFELISKIIRNGERVEDYRKNGQYTAFWPTNEAILRVLGAQRVKALQETANQAQAKEFLAGITVKGSYNLAALEEAAKSKKVLETVSGQSVSITKVGEKLFANGIEVLSTEYPASNGWVLATNGMISKDQ